MSESQQGPEISLVESAIWQHVASTMSLGVKNNGDLRFVWADLAAAAEGNSKRIHNCTHANFTL